MGDLSALRAVPRVGWVDAPSPVHDAPELALRLRLPALVLKRDDRIPALHGGTKVRKLDTLLAAEPWASAPAWVVSGAAGSGQVVATVAAGLERGRPVHAHLFRTPLGAHGLENLAFSCSHAASVTAYGSRPELAIRAPATLGVGQSAQGAVVPPGATTVAGMLGCVLGGVELAEQVAGGAAPAPDAVYVPLGSGGTAVGLAVGLALGGLSVPVVAIVVVERALAGRRRLDALTRALVDHVVALGVPRPPPVRLEIVRDQVGPGYARATRASLAAAAALAEHGIAGEPVYTGKALAGLAAHAAAHGRRRPALWVTVRRPGLPVPPDWEQAVPRRLRPRAGADGDLPATVDPVRRGLLVGAAAAVALVGLRRCTGYPDDGAPRLVLGAAEAVVVRAAAEAFFPDAPAAVLDRLPARVDHYLATFPGPMRAEVHALFFAVEHTLPLAVGLRRFSALAPADRLRAVEAAAALGGPGMLVARSLRDLVLVGWYQGEEAWAEIGYEGPMVGPERRPSAYDALRAPAGWSP